MKTSPLIHGLAQTLQNALHWWWSEMQPLVPGGIKALFSNRHILIAAEGPELHFKASWDENDEFIHDIWSRVTHTWLQSHSFEKLRALSRDALISLLVPEHLVLRQRITLPLAAKSNLQEAIAYGLSTWSPFTPDEVAVAARIVSSDEQQVSIDLRYVLRSQIASLIEEATNAGFAPDRMTFDPAGEWAVLIAPAKSRRLTRHRRIDLSLAAAATALFLTLLGTLVWRQNMELSLYQRSLRHELDLWKKEEAERKRLGELVARQTIVARNRDVRPAMVDVIGTIGAKLPEASFISSIDLAGGKGVMEIEGAEPSDLLQVLQTVELLSSIRLAPIQSGQPISVTFEIEGGRP
jgi:hypothetical protein